MLVLAALPSLIRTTGLQLLRLTGCWKELGLFFLQSRVFPEIILCLGESALVKPDLGGGAGLSEPDPVYHFSQKVSLGNHKVNMCKVKRLDRPTQNWQTEKEPSQE